MPSSDERRRAYDAYYTRTDFPHYAPRVDRAFLSAVCRASGVRPGALVIDLGCGTGVQALRLRELGFRTAGIDVSGVAVRRARDAGLPVVQGDGLALPFADASVDMVLAIGCSLMNVDDAVSTRMFSEALRVVRAGGCVVATTLTDFSGNERSGWIRRTRLELDVTRERIPASRTALRYTLPGLGRFGSRLPLHPVVHGLLRHLPALFPLPRTALFFAWKDDDGVKDGRGRMTAAHH